MTPSIFSQNTQTLLNVVMLRWLDEVLQQVGSAMEPQGMGQQGLLPWPSRAAVSPVLENKAWTLQ